MDSFESMFSEIKNFSRISRSRYCDVRPSRAPFELNEMLKRSGSEATTNENGVKIPRTPRSPKQNLSILIRNA